MDSATPGFGTASFRKVTRRPPFLGALSAILFLVLFPSLTRAQQPVDPSDADATWFVAMRGEPAAKTFARTRESLGDVAASAAEGAALARTTRDQVTRNRAEQDALLTTLRAAGLPSAPVFRLARVQNGVALHATPEEAARMRGLPGVERVERLAHQERHTDSSLHHMRVPDAVWQALGHTGEGMKLGIIDTGIDYLHTDFGGPGTGYGANDTTIVGDVAAFPGPRVVGGTDLAGENYNSASGDPAEFMPSPDPDPMDCNGHGSHVAGIAAGSGVNGDGTTYAGTYDDQLATRGLSIWPGVAPQADLYAIKVFGCTGTTLLVPAALEWALDPNGDDDFSDALDVVNVSIGGAFGSDLTGQEAVDNAVAAGLIAVFSAGNDGDTHYNHGGPGAAAGSIAVAAIQDERFHYTVRIDAPAAIAGDYRGGGFLFGGIPPYDGVTGEVVDAEIDGSCVVQNGGALAGKIALADYIASGCTASSLIANLGATGAIGIVLRSTSPTVPDISTSTGGIATPLPTLTVASTVGDAIRGALTSGSVTATILSGEVFRDPTKSDVVASFTSRGPAWPGTLLKPDCAAPGVFITSARAGSGTLPRLLSGTSMAAPHVAGAMALLRELHPDWTPRELKALLCNTATHDVYALDFGVPPMLAPPRVGAGRVDLAQAVASEVVAYARDAPGAAINLSFGKIDVLDTYMGEQILRVANKGNQPTALAFGYAPSDDLPGVTVGLPDGSIDVAAGSFVDVPVTLSAVAAAMNQPRDPAMASMQNGVGRYWMSEATGQVTIQPAVGPSLRVPLHAIVRPASDIHAESPILLTQQADGVLGIELAGPEVQSGVPSPDYPTDVISRANVFELAVDSPRIPDLPPTDRAGDIRYVGVRTMSPIPGNLPTTAILFGLATWGEWTTLDIPVFRVDIDLNNDNVADFGLVDVDRSTSTGGASATDTFTTLTFLQSSGFGDFTSSINLDSPLFRNTYPYHSNVMVMATDASDIGLSAGMPTFRFRSRIFTKSGLIDATDWVSYNAAAPGVNSNEATFDALAGNTISFDWNRSNFEANASRGLLLFVHHNRSATRAEQIPILEMIDSDSFSLR